MIKRLFGYYLFTLLFSVSSGFAFDFDWKTFTSIYSINRITERDGELWCATGGGLARFSPESGTFQIYTNTEGLAEIDLTDLVVDHAKRIWLGTKNGYLQRFDPESGQWTTVPDFIGRTIESLYQQGDSLWVGLDIGVSLYVISREETKETYKRLGTFQVEIPVIRSLTTQTDIWLITEEGVARASLSSSNLLDPSNWQNYSTGDGLPAGQLTAITSLNGQIVAGSLKGISIYKDDHWELIDPDKNVHDLCVQNDQLIAATTSGIFAWNGSGWQKRHNGNIDAISVHAQPERLWIGTTSGLKRLDSNETELVFYSPNSPMYNAFTDIALDQDGTVWCTSSNSGTGCISMYDGEQWINFTKKDIPSLKNDDFRTVAVDHKNNKWFGAWGGGLVKFDTDSGWTVFDAATGHLSGITADPNYVVVSAIEVDPTGAVWLLNSEAASWNPLVSVVDDTIWTYYGSREGIPSNPASNKYLVLEIDQYGRKWFGTYEGTPVGVKVYDDQGTPSDKSDDDALQGLSTTDGLNSLVITSLAEDHDGLMWIGTSAGLHYWPGGSDTPGVENRFYFAEDVKTIMVDGVNNIWVAHGQGVTIRFNKDYKTSTFKKEDSGLVSDDVKVMTLDPDNGYVYIGTNHGLSRAKTPYSEPLEKPEDLTIYPNPFIPSQHSHCVIDNLAVDTEVGIYTASGYKIRYYDDQTVAGRQLLWDGTNEAGDLVASGIYLVVSKTVSGDARVGKILVVR